MKKRCYGNRLTLGPFCRRQNWPSSLFALTFPNKMQHHFVYARINSNASTSCEILVKICAVTWEFKTAKYENLPRLNCNLTICCLIRYLPQVSSQSTPWSQTRTTSNTFLLCLFNSMQTRHYTSHTGTSLTLTAYSVHTETLGSRVAARYSS